MSPHRCLALLVTAIALAVAAVPAHAERQVTQDSAGRPIVFEIEASGVDVAGYTAILDGLLHGAEISDVVVTVVPPESIASECGPGAAACYRWSSRGGAVMFVPNLAPAQVRASLTHEYGHHVDATRPHLAGAPGLDGTAGWWRARGMADLLGTGEVTWDYALGWDRSIAEIFAEDYRLVHVPGETSKIAWLGPPSAAIADAIRADLGGATVPPAPPASAPQPVPPPTAGTSATARRAAGAGERRVVARAGGRLAAGARTRIGFTVTKAGRVVARVGGATAGRMRAVLRCGARALAGSAARPGRPAVVRARVAPGRCRLTLRAVGAPSGFRVVVSARA